MERPSLCNGSTERGNQFESLRSKNPLLEYKSEGFKMFQEMMADMNSLTVQRLFRTQIRGMESTENNTSAGARNIQASQ